MHRHVSAFFALAMSLISCGRPFSAATDTIASTTSTDTNPIASTTSTSLPPFPPYPGDAACRVGNFPRDWGCLPAWFTDGWGNITNAQGQSACSTCGNAGDEVWLCPDVNVPMGSACNRLGPAPYQGAGFYCCWCTAAATASSGIQQ